MKRKKANKKKEIKTKEGKINLYKILDSRYFHICIIDNPLKVDNIDWEIYYKNLPKKIYFSDANKPLLTSEKNTYDDIYKLKHKFENEKNQIKKKSKGEIFGMLLPILNYLNYLKSRITKLFVDLEFIVLMFNIINVLTWKSKSFSILSLTLSGLIAILLITKNYELDKEKEKCKNKIEDEIIQEKIKRQGMYFVEKLKGMI